MKYFLLLQFLTALIFVVLSIPNRPPSIYIQPPYDVYYKAEETVQMQCVADGVPKPRYNWTRNERVFDTSGNDNRMVMLQDSGTLVMNRPQNKDEGIFQCVAYNDLGTSLSININLREAMLENFPYEKDQEVRVNLGQYVKLLCTPPTSIPKAEIKWVLMDKTTHRVEAINLDNRITQDLEGRLYITNVKSEDYQGGRSYVCMATNYFMRKNTYSYGTVIIPVGNEENVPPQYLWSTPNEIFGLLGDSIRIKCIFSGNPTPEVHWENKTGKIPDNRRTLSLGGQELLITDLTTDDRGSYTCYTTSALGQRQQRNINIILKAVSWRPVFIDGGSRSTRRKPTTPKIVSKPYWLEGGEPKDIETSVGAKAVFVCKAGGDPEPVIEWFINGVKLKDSKHRTIKEGRLSKPNDNEVIVTDLRLGDAMVLQCNASNIFGYVFADTYLNVLREKPQFIQGPVKELKVAENTNVNLTCRTSGKPDPIITWYKGNQQITGGRYQIQANGDLYITNIVLSDAGNFTCVAQNENGTAADWGVMIVRRQSRIEQRPSDLEVLAQTDAKFTCSGTTDFEEVKQLRVKWLKDGKEISDSNQRVTTNVQDNSLTISGTISRDSGYYTCVVTNGLDEAKASAILTVKDKPEPPVDVKTKDCLKNKVTITWTKGGFNNAPVQYFTIQYNTSTEPDNWNFAATANQSENTYTLNLRSGVRYSFRLLATNKIGISDPSKHSGFCETDTDKPYKNPDNVVGIGDKPNYLVVEWTPMPPIDQGGSNFRYVIKISKAGSSPLNEIVTITNWRQNRYEFLTNDIYVPYNITIQAVNEHDNSAAPLKTYTIYSGESRPNTGLRVDNFVVDNAATDDNSAKFYWSWDSSRNDQLNGKFRGFKKHDFSQGAYPFGASGLNRLNMPYYYMQIQYWVKDKKRETFREDEVLEKDLQPRYGSKNKRATTEYMYTLTNLLPYTYMEAQICVMNTFYVSGPSAIVSFVTARGVPGPVENLTPVVIGSNFVELTWDIPELLNSPNEVGNTYLLGYDVGFRTVHGLNLGKMQNMDPQITDPTLTTVVLNGLTANQKYRIHMWGKTENGRGEDSFIEITTAKANAMKIPSFSIININSTFFNLTWEDILNKKYGTVAFVEYRIEGTSDWSQSPQEVSKSWIGISQLDTGTSYEVRLCVTNGGKTDKGDITNVKTKGFAAAYSLGANFGWFIGLILSVLILLAIATVVVLQYKRRPEPVKRKYVVPPRKETKHDDDTSTQDIVNKSSGSLNKGYDNYNYSDTDHPGYNGDRRYDDERRDYNRAYDDDDDDDRYTQYDKTKRRYDDEGYSKSRSGEYKRDYDDVDENYDNRYDNYDDRRRSDDYDRRDYDNDRRRDDDDDYDRRSDDSYERYEKNRHYNDRSEGGRYAEGAEYRPHGRRSENDRNPSDDNRPPSFAEDVDLREPAKFDADGSPVQKKSSSTSRYV